MRRDPGGFDRLLETLTRQVAIAVGGPPAHFQFAPRDMELGFLGKLLTADVEEFHQRLADFADAAIFKDLIEETANLQ